MVAVRRGRNGLATKRRPAASAGEGRRAHGLPPVPVQAMAGVHHDRSAPGKRAQTATSAHALRHAPGQPLVVPFTSVVPPGRARRARARLLVVVRRATVLKRPVSAGSPRVRRADVTKRETPGRRRRLRGLRFIGELRRKRPASEVLAATPAHRAKRLLARRDRADHGQKIDLGRDAPLSSRPLS
jgi:hypothetical protein